MNPDFDPYRRVQDRSKSIWNGYVKTRAWRDVVKRDIDGRSQCDRQSYIGESIQAFDAMMSDTLELVDVVSMLRRDMVRRDDADAYATSPLWEELRMNLVRLNEDAGLLDEETARPEVLDGMIESAERVMAIQIVLRNWGNRLLMEGVQ